MINIKHETLLRDKTEDATLIVKPLIMNYTIINDETYTI